MILLNAAESRELDRISQEKYAVPSYWLFTWFIVTFEVRDERELERENRH